MASSEPYFEMKRSTVLEQYQSVVDLGVIVSYSVKTNAYAAKILQEETGSVYNVHSVHDLGLVADLNKVYFLLQGTSQDLVHSLIDRGVRKFIVDNESDYAHLFAVLENCTHSIDVQLRLKLKEHSMDTGRYFVFGMDADMVKERITSLRRLPCVRELGIHMYRKTQNIAEWNILFELQQTFEEDFWQHIDIVNIGGGLPAKYKNSSDKSVQGIFEKSNL